jgi:glutamate 5-kinase
MKDDFEKLELDISLQDFINDSNQTENAVNDCENKLSFQNIDNSLKELSNAQCEEDNPNFQVDFKDGYSLKIREDLETDSTLLKVTNEEFPEITLQKNYSGELETIEIETGDDKQNIVFKIPESNITIDPFLDGKLSSYKNPTQIKMVILKIGTSSITTPSAKINYSIIQSFAETILKLREAGYATIIVSSGAKGLGKELVQAKNSDLSAQSLTSIGQSHLISIYDNIFKNYQLTTAQILLAYNDLEYKENIRSTILDLTRHDIVPILNSNDPVICSVNIDIDNDKLAAAIGKILNASHLFIISDSGGLYDSDPNSNPDAKLLKNVSEISEEIDALATSESGSGLGTGGIRSKIIAARSCLMREGEMDLISIDQIEHITDIVVDKNFDFEGTRFTVKS